MTERRVLVETRHLLAIEQQQTSDAVFVTFSPLGFSAHGGRFWADDFLGSCGFAAIGIVAKTTNWFPPEDMAGVVATVRGGLAGRRVVTYGTSQGGYGALKYGRALGAASALAFAPQWSIDPRDVGPFDTRFEQYHDPRLGGGSAVVQSDLCPRNIIVYDPLEPWDRPNAERLLRLAGTEGVTCPFSGHFAVTMLAEARQSRLLLSRMALGQPVDAQDVRRALRESRRASPSYTRARVSELSRRGVKLAGLALHRRFERG